MKSWWLWVKDLHKWVFFWGIFCVNSFLPVLQVSEEGESGENESIESGSGQYRTYTPPPLLDEVAEATESAPEGMYYTL